MFSELVEHIIEVSGRLDKSSVIVGNVNATLRELHTEFDFDRDLVEDRILKPVGSGTTSFSWDRPKKLRKMSAVRADGRCWLTYVKPGARLEGLSEFYYTTGSCYHFTGPTSLVDVVYYSWPQRMVWYEKAKRPAIYDPVTCMWKYLDAAGEFVATLGNEDVEEAARCKVSSWVLEDWTEVVKQGALAKLYSDLDDSRGGRAFAIFEDMRKDLIRTETQIQRGV